MLAGKMRLTHALSQTGGYHCSLRPSPVSCSDTLDGMVTITVLATPGGGGKLIERSEVDRIGIRHAEVTSHELPHVLGQDRPDGMDRVVAIEALRLQALQRGYGWRQLPSELTLDRGVNQGVQSSVWQGDPRSSMILLHEGDLLAFIEREPLSRFRRNSGIVSHVACLDAV